MSLMNKTEREKLFETLKNSYPDPRCELNWTNHFSLLVAIILSAQSTDKNVNRVTEKLFPVADTPEAFLNLGYEKVREYVSLPL